MRSVWIKNFPVIAMLFVAFAASERAHGQAKSDTTIYVDPDGRFEWIIPAQQVAGLDVEMLACHAYLKKGKSEPSQSLTFIHFFVPEEFPSSIEIRQENRFSEIKPGKKTWPKGLFQCLGLPNAYLHRLLPELSKFSAAGKMPVPNRLHLMPIAVNVQLPDSISYYEFRFAANQEIRVKYSIIQQIGPDKIILQDTLRYYPARAAFPLRWDGRFQGKAAPEGNYELRLEGYKYEKNGSQRIHGIWHYYFFHKPRWELCVEK